MGQPAGAAPPALSRFGPTNVSTCRGSCVHGLRPTRLYRHKGSVSRGQPRLQAVAVRVVKDPDCTFERKTAFSSPELGKTISLPCAPCAQVCDPAQVAIMSLLLFRRGVESRNAASRSDRVIGTPGPW